ncbi:unnamed protein product [Schistosoma margrebowiei]|uniref:Uncharacterized protein n=1 Tax=Schistosoma margrebowiei TaxID=48269 RepID=A0A183N5V1_9TREM|nr:unnamed protein product [Schistosoma margrebowiei]
MEAGDQRLVHTPFVPSGYCSPCAPLVCDPVKAPDIRFSSSQFRKQHPRHEKASMPRSSSVSSLWSVDFHRYVDLPDNRSSTYTQHMERSTPALQRPAEPSTSDVRQASALQQHPGSIPALTQIE